MDQQSNELPFLDSSISHRQQDSQHIQAGSEPLEDFMPDSQTDTPLEKIQTGDETTEEYVELYLQSTPPFLDSSSILTVPSSSVQQVNYADSESLNDSSDLKPLDAFLPTRRNFLGKVDTIGLSLIHSAFAGFKSEDSGAESSNAANEVDKNKVLVFDEETCTRNAIQRIRVLHRTRKDEGEPKAKKKRTLDSDGGYKFFYYQIFNDQEIITLESIKSQTAAYKKKDEARNTYRCTWPQCSYSGRTDNIEPHIRTHLGLGFKCLYCDKNLSSDVSNLRKHFKREHWNQGIEDKDSDHEMGESSELSD